MNISPVLLGAVSDSLQLSASRAGLLTTLEMLAFGVGTLVVGPWVAYVPQRRVVVAAAALVAVAQLVSASSRSYPLLAVVRVLAGLNEGALVAVAYALIAGRRDSQTAYSNCAAATITCGSAAYLAVPLIAAQLGHYGAYGYVGCFALAALPLVWRLPGHTAAPTWPAAAAATRVGDVLCLLAGIVIVLFSDGLVWPLSERIARSAGLSPAATGILLCGSSLCGALGALLAGRLASRHGLMIPVLGAIWTTGIGGVLMAHATGSLTLAVGAVVKNLSLLFFIPLALQVAALLDRQGRVSAIAGGLIPLGAGLGPVVAGVIVERAGYGAIGWVGLAAVAAATPFWLRALRAGGVRG